MRYVLAGVLALGLFAGAPVVAAFADNDQIVCYTEGVAASCVQPAEVVLDSSSLSALAGQATGTAVSDALLYERQEGKP